MDSSPLTNDEPKSTVDELFANFTGAVVALVPWLDKADVKWKEGESYDEWDDIVFALYRGIVCSALYPELDEYPIAEYFNFYASYAEIDYIVVTSSKHPDVRFAFIGFENVAAPFDTIRVAVLGADESITEDPSIPNEGVSYSHARLRDGAREITQEVDVPRVSMITDQVRKLLDADGTVINEEWTEAMEAVEGSGNTDRSNVYELADGRVMRFIIESGLVKEVIFYSREEWLRVMAWTLRVRHDYRNRVTGSYNNWLYYSKNGDALIRRVRSLTNELARVLGIERQSLDFSDESLDTVSRAVEQMGVDQAREKVYDNLVAYVGEVLRRHVDGRWVADSNISAPHRRRCNLPEVETPDSVMLDPVSVVWEHLLGQDSVDLRTAMLGELRRADPVQQRGDISEP